MVQLIVNDGTVDSQPDTVMLTTVNRPPVLAPIGDRTVVLGDTLVLQLLATDPDGDPLTFAVDPLPANASLNATTGRFTFTPAANQVGTLSLTFSVSDGQLTDAKSTTITVVQCPAPTITAITPLTGPVGTEVTITRTNLNCGTLTLTFNGVPAVISSRSPTVIKTFIPLGGQDGLFSLTTGGGTVTAPPAFVFDVVLSRDFSLAIAPADAPVVQGSSTTYRVTASGTGGFADLITLSVTGLPAGVSGSLSPDMMTTGQSALLTVTAADTATVTSAPFTITGTARIDAMTVSHAVSGNLIVLGKGGTNLVGRILDTDALPIKGVAIRVRAQTAFTDDNGNFLLQGLPAGEQVVVIDGGPASTEQRHYPLIPVSVTLVAGVTNELPYVPHLHVQKNFNFTPIDPAHDTIATDPALPGVALRIPAGTQIIGIDGQPNTMVSIRTVPIDRLPIKPPPPEVRARTVYMFYFGKQGGGIPSQPIPFTAPNDLGMAPGDKAELWYFDESTVPGEAPNDWRMAGLGTVSADGKTIATDPLGNTMSLAYDAQGNLVTITNSLGNVTNLIYDGVSRLVAQTDPRGNTTRFTYDALDRITQIVDSIDGHTVSSYDASNLTSLVYRTGTGPC